MVTGGDREVPSTEVLELGQARLKWETAAHLELPINLERMQVMSYQGDIFLFGGNACTGPLINTDCQLKDTILKMTLQNGTGKVEILPKKMASARDSFLLIPLSNGMLTCD